MTKLELIQRLQNSPFTRWWWKMWIHNTTRRIIMVPFYKNPGKQYELCKFRE
jgi:hypothetical protein